MLIKDIMKKNPLTIQVGKTIIDARDLMKKEGVPNLPVVDKDGTLVGIFTTGDLNKAWPSEATTLDMFEITSLLSKVLVDKVMVKSVKTTFSNESVEEAARLMSDYGISCLPVVDNGVLTGLVTQKDLFDCFIKMFSTKNPGLRVQIVCDEKPGVLARLTDAIAKKNGNLVSVVTSDAEDENKRSVTLKVSGISEEDLKQFVAASGAELIDIRSV